MKSMTSLASLCKITKVAIIESYTTSNKQSRGWKTSTMRKQLRCKRSTIITRMDFKRNGIKEQKRSKDVQVQKSDILLDIPQSITTTRKGLSQK